MAISSSCFSFKFHVTNCTELQLAQQTGQRPENRKHRSRIIAQEEMMAHRGVLCAGRRTTVRELSCKGGGSYAAFCSTRHAAINAKQQQRSVSSNCSGRQPSYAVPKAPTPTLSVLGSEECFPVRRVYCVGSNYR